MTLDARLRELEVKARGAPGDAHAWANLARAALREARLRLAWEAVDRGAQLGGVLEEPFLGARAALGEAWGIPFELEAIDRPRASYPRRQRFWQPRVTVGRYRGNDVVVEEDAVEGNHAWFRSIGGELGIENRFAASVTTVNGSRVSSRARLRLGDLVGFGSARLKVVKPTSVTARPAASEGVIGHGIEGALAALGGDR